MISVVRPFTARGRRLISHAALLATLALSVWGMAAYGLRAQECVQPSVDGCPLEIGQRASAVLADGTDVHTWLLQLRTRGDLVVALTDLLVDYDVHLYGPDGELVEESLNEGPEDEVVLIPDLPPGEYRIYVNSGRGEAAPIPYSLLAMGPVAPGGEAASQPVAVPDGQQLAPTAEPTTRPGQTLLRFDDFSDPAKGLFLDNQRGTNRITFRDGVSHQYEWEYSYAEGGLLARIRGPYPENPDRAHLGYSAAAADRVIEDFAVEVRASATKSPSAAQIALRYVLPGTPQVLYEFGARPGDSGYHIWLNSPQRVLVSGRSSAINRGYEENHLRMEVRGDTMRVFANGRLIDEARHEGIATRSGRFHLIWAMWGAPEDGDVEVRFTDFRVYALGT